MPAVPLLLLMAAVAALGFGVVLPRMNELFCVSVRGGRLLVVRGRLPGPLRRDLEDIVTRCRIERATIRAVRSDGHARLVATGVDDGVAQRMRNAFGLYDIAKLRAAPLTSRRNLGQLLGFAWLAWLLVPRR